MRVTIELGMGNGDLLKKLAEQDKEVNSIYIGIEVNKVNYDKAKSNIKSSNVILLNGSFEDFIHYFADYSLHMVIAVLPDPDFIDKHKQYRWEKFYQLVYSKLTNYGRFILVTEIIDDLLEPVTDSDYNEWVEWLVITFRSIGYNLVSKKEGAPSEYSSECLERFKRDPARVRLVTLDLIKQE